MAPRTWTLALGLALASLPCGAQELPRDPSTPETAEARDARAGFEAGLAALRDERYADALGHFERSYRARRVASVALNLGVTLRGLGRLLEARQRLREFLALASAPQHAQHDAEVTSYLAAIERQVGRVHVTGVEHGACVVHVDQRRVRLDGGGEFEVDPGEHVVNIEPDGYLPVRRTVRVEAGDTAELPVAPSRPPGWVFTRWWFWSGVALAVGAGAAAGVVYSQTPQDPPATNTGLVLQGVR